MYHQNISSCEVPFVLGPATIKEVVNFGLGIYITYRELLRKECRNAAIEIYCSCTIKFIFRCITSPVIANLLILVCIVFVFYPFYGWLKLQQCDKSRDYLQRKYSQFMLFYEFDFLNRFSMQKETGWGFEIFHWIKKHFTSWTWLGYKIFIKCHCLIPRPSSPLL